jgi:hexulose-6-phosphate isomerase
MNLGVLQGRLSKSVDNKIQEFPHSTWKKEFEYLSDLNLVGIEWLITPANNFDNPFFNEKNLPTNILSVCVDTMVNPLFYEKSFLEKNLTPILNRMYELEIKKIIIPLLEDSDITDYNIKSLFLERILNVSNKFKEIDFCFEFECNKEIVYDFVNNDEKFYITYDTGNFTSFYKEKINHIDLIKYFGNKIKNVHIKDRTYYGKTKELGLGNTNFKDIFIGLKDINYNENLILQLAREVEGNEFSYLKNSIKKIKNLI